MSRHTPGSWVAVGFSGARVGDADGDATVKAPTAGVPFERRAADIRLIAATPDLLEALQSLMTETEESGVSEFQYYGWPKAMDTARAAISKATQFTEE